MKTFIKLLTILLPCFCDAQKLTFKSYAPTATFIFLAGMTDGFRDVTSFHMDGASNFFNGKQSWKNKYKNRDQFAGEAYFGSTTFLAFTTDAAHLSNMFTHQFSGMALAYVPYDPNKKFFHVFLKVAAYNAIRQAGHSIIYDMTFRR